MDMTQYNTRSTSNPEYKQVVLLRFYCICFIILIWTFAFSMSIKTFPLQINQKSGKLEIKNKGLENRIWSYGFHAKYSMDCNRFEYLYYYPSWLSLYENNPLSISNEEFLTMISFELPTDAIFSLFSVVPDSITPKAIYYSNRDKIDRISRNGLSFYAQCPQLETANTIRYFLISVFLTLIVHEIWIRQHLFRYIYRYESNNRDETGNKNDKEGYDTNPEKK